MKLTFVLVHGLGTQLREKGIKSSRTRAEVSKIELHDRIVVQCAMVSSSCFVSELNLTVCATGMVHQSWSLLLHFGILQSFVGKH